MKHNDALVITASSIVKFSPSLGVFLIPLSGANGIGAVGALCEPIPLKKPAGVNVISRGLDQL
jgi:hypothetical protein